MNHCGISFVVAAFMSVALCDEAIAQNDCMQSFAVKAEKSVSKFDWVPGSGVAPAGTVSCVALERSREDYFVLEQQRIMPDKLGTAANFEAELNALASSIAKKQLELRKLIDSNATSAALKVAFKVLWYEIGKSLTIIGCLAPDPTLITKVGCFVGVVDTAINTQEVLSGDITKTKANELEKKLAAQVKTLEGNRLALLAKKDKYVMDEVGKGHTRTFLAMCQAVKSNCL